MTATQNDEYQAFLAWQCRLRKLAMRELDGRPTAGMSAGIYALAGGDEQARIQFLILPTDTEWRTREFRHIVRKSPDPEQWVNNGLRILAEHHYLDASSFDRQLTALFSLDSAIADALLQAGACHLAFAEKTMDWDFDFDIRLLDEADRRFQATYWHNHLFNPSLPGKIRILAFSPRLG